MSNGKRRKVVALVAVSGLIGFLFPPPSRGQESVRPRPGGGESVAPADPAGTPARTAGTPVTIPNAEFFDLRSKAGLEYRIFVAGPTGKVAASGAPVIYLSDGNSNFPVLLAAVHRQSREDPQAVVVGIGYPSDDSAVHRDRRVVDLTLADPGQTGGNGQFLSFIEAELKPVIEQKYKIDRHRQTLFGHSFGGLFVLHVLFNKPEAFQTYLASSPSIWWKDGRVLDEEKAFRQKYADEKINARVLISVGEWEKNAMPNESKERAELLQKRRMAGNAQELVNRLSAASIPGLTVVYREFAEEHHGSVVLPAASRGVRFALDGK